MLVNMGGSVRRITYRYVFFVLPLVSFASIWIAACGSGPKQTQKTHVSTTRVLHVNREQQPEFPIEVALTELGATAASGFPDEAFRTPCTATNPGTVRLYLISALTLLGLFVGGLSGALGGGRRFALGAGLGFALIGAVIGGVLSTEVRSILVNSPCALKRG